MCYLDVKRRCLSYTTTLTSPVLVLYGRPLPAQGSLRVGHLFRRVDPLPPVRRAQRAEAQHAEQQLEQDVIQRGQRRYSLRTSDRQHPRQQGP